MPDRTLTTEEIANNRKRVRFIKPWLDHRNLTQRKIAESLEVSEATVSKWLNGTQTISVEKFFAIAGLLDAKPEDLLAGGPDAEGRGQRFRRLAELATALPNDALDALILSGEAMKKAQTKD